VVAAPPPPAAQEATRAAPRHAPLYRAWAIAEEGEGNYAAARAAFAQGLAADPQHAQLYHAWARMEAKLANLDGLAKLDEHARRHFGGGALGGAQAAGEGAAGVTSEELSQRQAVAAEMYAALPPQFRQELFQIDYDST
jgi:ferric-dicitrate binding protein FerR (iron transport regulator)